MTTLTILGDIAIFAGGVVATLSWQKIKAWLTTEETRAVAAAKADVAAAATDVAKKL